MYILKNEIRNIKHEENITCVIHSFLVRMWYSRTLGDFILFYLSFVDFKVF